MGKTFMINTTSEKVSEVKGTCCRCGKGAPTGNVMCLPCQKAMKGIFEAKDDLIEEGLAKANRTGRKVDRAKVVRSLARDICKPAETVAAKMEELKKGHKAMREKLRRRNGFKSDT